MQFRDLAIERHLAERPAPGRSLGMVAARDLGRYHDVLRRELARVALSEAEAWLLVDVGNGTRWERHSIPLLWAEVADAIDGEGLAEKWQLAGEGHTPAEHFEAGSRLIAKLRALTPAQAVAVVDAIERAWAAEQIPAMRERVRAVGLVWEAADQL